MGKTAGPGVLPETDLKETHKVFVSCATCGKEGPFGELLCYYHCKYHQHRVYLCSLQCQQKFKKLNEKKIKEQTRIHRCRLSHFQLSSLEEIMKKNCLMCVECDGPYEFHEVSKASVSFQCDDDTGQSSSSGASGSALGPPPDTEGMPAAEQDRNMLKEIRTWMLEQPPDARDGKTEEAVHDWVDALVEEYESAGADSEEKMSPIVEAIHALPGGALYNLMKSRWRRFREEGELLILRKINAKFDLEKMVVKKKDDDDFYKNLAKGVNKKGGGMQKNNSTSSTGSGGPASSKMQAPFAPPDRSEPPQQRAGNSGGGGDQTRGRDSPRKTREDESSMHLTPSTAIGTASVTLADPAPSVKGTATGTASSDHQVPSALATKRAAAAARRKAAAKENAFKYNRKVLNVLAHKLHEAFVEAGFEEEDEDAPWIEAAEDQFLENWILDQCTRRELKLHAFVTEVVSEAGSMQWDAFCMQCAFGRAKLPRQVDSVYLIHFLAFVGDRAPETLCQSDADGLLPTAMRLAGTDLMEGRGLVPEAERRAQAEILHQMAQDREKELERARKEEHERRKAEQLAVWKAAREEEEIAKKRARRIEEEKESKKKSSSPSRTSIDIASSGNGSLSKTVSMEVETDAITSGKTSSTSIKTSSKGEPQMKTSGLLGEECNDVLRGAGAELVSYRPGACPPTSSSSSSSSLLHNYAADSMFARPPFEHIRHLSLEFYQYLVVVEADYSHTTNFRMRWRDFVGVLIAPHEEALRQSVAEMADGKEASVKASALFMRTRKRLGISFENPSRWSSESLYLSFLDVARLLPEPGWKCCKSPSSGRIWWMNQASGEWFFEDAPAHASGWVRRRCVLLDNRVEYWFEKVAGAEKGRWFHASMFCSATRLQATTSGNKTATVATATA
ncbi:unnamed protein product [Amoebophrya sp. A25]|nr:unnamed protein product [Amoebophrya sp. A25]|eukprot:GSA25T00006145001.1